MFAMEMSMQYMGVGIIVMIVFITIAIVREDQSGAMIAPAAQVHAYAPTKIQKERYSFHKQPYFEMPSWQKMTVAVSRT
jgi:hypothetical protein